MKYFEIKIYGKRMKVRFSKLKYHDRSEALELIEHNGQYEEAWSRLSVNTGLNPPFNTFWIKTWSENKETVASLINDGYLEPTGQTIACGFSEAIACKLTTKARPFTSRDL